MKTNIINKNKLIGIFMIFSQALLFVELHAAVGPENETYHFQNSFQGADVYAYDTPSDVTYENMYGQPLFSAREGIQSTAFALTDEDIELGGVERPVPVGDGVLIFVLAIAGYATVAYKKKKRISMKKD